MFAVVVAAGAAGALLLGASASGDSTSDFTVIFDDARGLIAGQLVKVAGANAGSITNVSLCGAPAGNCPAGTPDFKAKIDATIDTKFLPFYSNATCTIRPQGLIAENYIECDPGNPSGGAQAVPSPPTVPLARTTEPVSLLDLFNMFNLPTREQFAEVVNEFGIGTAGRGDDFNAILERANPALALARRVISILSAQKAQLATLIDATNTVASQAAAHTTDVQSFLTNAASVSTLTAAHAGNLSLAISRLPGLLAAAQPALAQLNTVAADGTPLVQQLGNSAPALNRVATDLGPFVAAAKPGLKKLGTALTKAVPAIKSVTPLLKVVNTYLAASLPTATSTEKILSNLQQHGFFENFLSILYDLSEVFARYDAAGHLGVAYLAPVPASCSTFATSPVAGCSSNQNLAPGTFTPLQHASSANAAARSSATAPAVPGTAASGTAGSTRSGLSTLIGGTTSTLGSVVSSTTKLLGKTLGGLSQSLGLGQAGSGSAAGSQGSGSQSSALQNLIKYLLK
jgi:ABC-type transporter Mla subunit MlaD